MAMKIKFCGAAGTVTGSCFWVQLGDRQFLVDCGMFQGSKSIKELNYGTFPFDPKQIDFVLVTHAHTDHAGLLPKLVKYGFSGPIYTTSGTRDLLTYMLPDSAHIQDMEVSRLNRRNRQRGRGEVEPIYNMDDVDATLALVRTVEYESWLDLAGVRARYWNAGHILGASSIELNIDQPGDEAPTHMLFSGDIGPDHKLFHPDPEAPSDLDYLFVESTYGGRWRVDLDTDARRALLAREINDAMERGGALVIPAFAVERTQELLMDIADLLRQGEIPHVPVFLDSPLAIRVTSVFADHAPSLEDIEGQKPFDHPSFHFTETTEESKSIARFSGNVIILAASGMCDAGRIRHHLKNHLWRPQSTVLLVGYQAEGTLGRMLEEGAKRVKIQGEDIKVRARIRTIDTYSGHADHDGLMEWVNERLPVRRCIFLCHGSIASLEAMHKALADAGLPEKQIIVPKLDDEFTLADGKEHPTMTRVVRRLEPAAVEKGDWHNDLASLTLDLRQELESAKDDEQRTKLLARLRTLLDQFGGSSQGHHAS